MEIGSMGNWRTWLSPRRKRFWVVIFLLAYTLAGFFLLPWAVKREAPGLAQSFLKRDASVERVEFNPWTLHLHTWGLSLYDNDGSVLAEVDELHLNLQLRSLFRLALVFREAEIVGPRVNISRSAFNETNIGRLVEDMASEPAPAEPATESNGLRLVIDALSISSGYIALRDELPQTPFDTLIGPIDINLENLSTLPDEEGRQQVSITTETGARINWTGSLTVTPLDTSGTIQLSGSPLPLVYRYFDDSLGFTLDNCCMDVALNYTARALPDGSIEAGVSGLELSLRNVILRERVGAADIFTLPELSVSGGEFQWPAATARIREIRFDKPVLQVRVNADATLNLDQLIVPENGAEAATTQATQAPADAATPATALATEPAAAAATPPPADAPEFDLLIDTLRIDGMQVGFTDNRFAPAGTVALSDLNVVLAGVSSLPGAAAQLNLSAGVANSGKVSLEGQVVLMPAPALTAELSVRELALALLQPWVQQVAMVAIDSGNLNMSGTLAANEAETLLFTADVGIADLNVSDTLRKERLAGWGQLDIEELRLDLDESQLEISRVRLAEPFARILIAEDRSTNFGALAVEQPVDTEQPGESGQAEAPDSPQEFVIRIGETIVEKGSADYRDLALPLPFQADITELSGRLSALATDSAQASTLRLEGTVAEYGLVTVDGTLNVLDPTRQASITALFRNVNMPDLSPYTADFAGQKIDSGKLDLDLVYNFDNRLMKGDNKMVLTQFELGEKIDNPDALDLPLGLAVALLKDVNGVIDLQLGVSGDLDDPEFSASGIVLKAFANLITKLVAAPFKLLGALVPGGDDPNFSAIGFVPGRADLTPPQREKLAQLGIALTQRPALMLEVPGGFNAEADVPALQSNAIETLLSEALGDNQGSSEQLLSKTRKALEKLAKDSGLFGELSPREMRAGFTRADPATGEESFDELAYSAELRQRLADSRPIATAELEALAIARQDAIVTELAAAELPAGRVSQTGITEVAVDDAEVRIELGLEVDKNAAGKAPPKEPAPADVDIDAAAPAAVPPA